MNPFERTESLIGAEGLQKLRGARIILFGVGGVGSWCAEALVRSGVGHLTLVDSDCVEPSNLNRQLMTTAWNIGRPKVEVMKERLLSIVPDADITALRRRYSAGEDFCLESYDAIIDAIDSLSDKAALMLEGTAAPGRFYSSMGAARKIDPTRVRVAEFWDVRGCPLGAALRKKMRKAGTLPSKPFLCVYDDEVLGTEKGTLAHITGIFGLTLAGLVMQDLLGDGTPGTLPSADNLPTQP